MNVWYQYWHECYPLGMYCPQNWLFLLALVIGTTLIITFLLDIYIRYFYVRKGDVK